MGRLASVVASGVESEVVGVAVSRPIGFDERDNPVYERPDAKSEPAEQKFGNAEANLTAQETVHAKFAEDKGAKPHE